MKKKIKLKGNFLIIIFSIIIVILCIIYACIINKYRLINKFANNNMKIYENNENPIFKIEKIVVCNSANAIDNSENKSMKKLNLYQYSDIALYIDNGEDLTNKNTIKNLYIDDINFKGNDEIGTKSLKYKNLLDFGLKQNIENIDETNENIDFKVIYTNQENEQANYDYATFYTDCSNPITLEYVNYNIVQDFPVGENNSISFDGSILKDANISNKDIACKVKFKIHIVNNDDEIYSCPISINIPLKDIYKGTTMKVKTAKENEYVFFRES